MSAATPAFASPDPPLGLICERGTALAGGQRCFGAPVCLVPLEASVVSVALPDGVTRAVDKANVLLLPGDLSHRIARRSAVANLATFVIHRDIRRAAVAEYGVELDFAREAQLFGEVALLPRTIWVNELCHRYVFERVHCGKHASLAARFVELELVKELLFLLGERRARVERATVAIVPATSTVVARALSHLEERLFEPLDMGGTARAAGASPSTLLRAFKRELGVTPSAWLRGRRLDEAMLLLKTQRMTVGEVAQHVGYGSIASFTHAFSHHFGQLPSAVRDGSDP